MTWTDSQSWAALSPDGRYRYALGRPTGILSPHRLCVGLLNPSTADALKPDPTDRRVLGFARSWGFGSYVIVNPWAHRATDRRELLKVPDPIGPENDQWIRQAVDRCDLFVAGWGAYPTQHSKVLMPRIESFVALVSKPIHCFRLLKSGAPEHPLYLPGNLEPVLWRT